MIAACLCVSRVTRARMVGASRRSAGTVGCDRIGRIMVEPLTIDADAVEVVLFDLGGVVFDFDWQRALQVWASASGVDTEVLRDRFHHSGAYERFERGELTPSEYFSRLRDQLDLDIDIATVAEGWNAIFGELIPGITNVVAAVKASPLQMAALSNTNAAHAAVFGPRYAVALADIEPILTSHELGARKPEAACFRAACDRLGTPPAGVLFFDDTASNVTAARAFGMQAVEVSGVDDIREALVAVGVPVSASAA